MIVYGAVETVDFIKHVHVLVVDGFGPLETVTVPEGECDPMLVAKGRMEALGYRVVSEGDLLVKVER